MCVCVCVCVCVYTYIIHTHRHRHRHRRRHRHRHRHTHYIYKYIYIYIYDLICGRAVWGIGCSHADVIATGLQHRRQHRYCSVVLKFGVVCVPVPASFWQRVCVQDHLYTHRHRHRHRHRNRHTDTHRYTHAHTHADRQTARHTGYLYVYRFLAACSRARSPIDR